MKLVSDIRLLLLGIWLGAACFFIGVAQVAFAVLPQRELAGAVVSRTLAIINYSGLGIGIFLILLTLLASKNTNRLLLWSERFLLLVLAAACAVGQFVIGWWILLLRTQVGKPLDELAADDPLKTQFNTLHQYSEWALIAAMAAALIAFFIVANRKFGVNKKTTSDPYDFSKEFKV
ncbi:MAG: DUF4149 domain-containing protein [Pyrinomonadaceae bacterium]